MLFSRGQKLYIIKGHVPFTLFSRGQKHYTIKGDVPFTSSGMTGREKLNQSCCQGKEFKPFYSLKQTQSKSRLPFCMYSKHRYTKSQVAAKVLVLDFELDDPHSNLLSFLGDLGASTHLSASPTSKGCCKDNRCTSPIYTTLNSLKVE